MSHGTVDPARTTRQRPQRTTPPHRRINRRRATPKTATTPLRATNIILTQCNMLAIRHTIRPRCRFTNPRPPITRLPVVLISTRLPRLTMALKISTTRLLALLRTTSPATVPLTVTSRLHQ